MVGATNASALILAGGRATRFGGIAKHELVIDGATIFARQVAVLAPRVAEILVSSARDVAGYRTVRDAIAGAGPLAGIAAGLAACTTPWLLVVAGDMPYLTGTWIDLLLGSAEDSVDAVGIRIGGLPEPLLCLLHTRTRSTVERLLAAERYKASGLLTDVAVRVAWLDEPSIRAIDPALRGLANVNAPDDV